MKDRKIKIIIVAVILLALVLLNMKLDISGAILSSIFGWVAHFDKKYQGAASFIGSIVASFIAIIGVFIAYLLNRNGENNRKKEILAHSLINVQRQIYSLSKNGDLSLEEKVSSISLYIPYIYNSECKEYTNLIKDYEIRFNIINWIMMIEQTPAEIVHPGAIAEFSKHIENALEELGYYCELKDALVDYSQNTIQNSMG